MEFWLEPYIPKSAIVMAHGKFGTYKTPVLTSIAKGIADPDQEEIFGCALEHGKVLCIQADTPKNVIVPRYKGLGVGLKNLHFNFCYPGFNILDPFKEPEDSFYYQLLYRKHRKELYDVVLIDSLRAIHGEDDKESQTPHRVYRALTRLFPKASIVIIHHDSKDNPDKAKDETFSGSQAWLNHATVGIKFSHKDKGKEEITLEHTKSQASELAPPLHIGMQGGVLARSLAQAKLDEVESYMRGLEKEGKTSRELDLEIAGYFGISERTARRRRLDVEKGGKL